MNQEPKEYYTTVAIGLVVVGLFIIALVISVMLLVVHWLIRLI